MVFFGASSQLVSLMRSVRSAAAPAPSWAAESRRARPARARSRPSATADISPPDQARNSRRFILIAMLARAVPGNLRLGADVAADHLSGRAVGATASAVGLAAVT